MSDTEVCPMSSHPFYQLSEPFRPEVVSAMTVAGITNVHTERLDLVRRLAT